MLSGPRGDGLAARRAGTFEMTDITAPFDRNGVLRTLVRIFAVVLIALGLVIFAGGVWLIALGGSWYYAFAGAGLVISGVGVWRGEAWGVWAYLVVYALTWVWALWEVGWDGWALVPRVV